MTASQEWLDFRRRRESLGLSRDALADRAGVYRDSIYNAETGKTRNPRRSTLALLNRALDAAELEQFGPPPEPAPVVEEAPESTPVVATGVLRVTIEGINGGNSTISVEAPVANLSELSRLVDRILDHLAAQAQEDGA